MNIAKLIFFILLFCACSKHYDSIDLGSFDTKCFIEEKSKTIIYVNAKNNIYNFAMFDLFGVPMASKIFFGHNFKSNKFLPRNDDEIFYKILTMINDNNDCFLNEKYHIKVCK